MTKPIPQIQKYMTRVPAHIEVTCPLKDAALMMKEEGFRHLPVMQKGKIMGMLSMTDVNATAMLVGSDISKLKVDDIYHRDPCIVTAEAKLDEVCEMMVLHKYGSVLVADNEKLVGIFTWIDALKAMDELLHSRLK